ncbi:uncharacterized protein LOC141901180 isoform X3 [Tubulanus polymorphus]|uniref:uncharacterized protein LOC141901180 isoform X3 n=1 Tax=Tubulanus polymorphus TaxID=672921 RepID=UPI003DA2D8DF
MDEARRLINEDDNGSTASSSSSLGRRSSFRKHRDSVEYLRHRDFPRSSFDVFDDSSDEEFNHSKWFVDSTFRDDGRRQFSAGAASPERERAETSRFEGAELSDSSDDDLFSSRVEDVLESVRRHSKRRSSGSLFGGKEFADDSSGQFSSSSDRYNSGRSNHSAGSSSGGKSKQSWSAEWFDNKFADFDDVRHRLFRNFGRFNESYSFPRHNSPSRTDDYYFGSSKLHRSRGFEDVETKGQPPPKPADVAGHCDCNVCPIHKNLKFRSNYVYGDSDSDDDCQYTCHQRCRNHVTLDCENPGEINNPAMTTQTTTTSTSSTSSQAALSPLSPLFHDSPWIPPSSSATLPLYTPSTNRMIPQSNNKVSAETSTDSGFATAADTTACQFEGLTLKEKIHEYNSLSHSLTMTLDEEYDTFQGSIRVHLNLSRPISMAIGTRPPSIYEVLAHEEIKEDDSLTTSFYLPRNVDKPLHISSSTTAREVITILLKKFHITDNPMKFALYEHYTEEDNKVKIRKLSDFERPLYLYLEWCPDKMHDRRLVLQENELAEIVWDEFSTPELNNFLMILNREEKDHMEQVRQRYRVIRMHMDNRLHELEIEMKANNESFA